jgi:hypothetical protein
MENNMKPWEAPLVCGLQHSSPQFRLAIDQAGMVVAPIDKTCCSILIRACYDFEKIFSGSYMKGSKMRLVGTDIDLQSFPVENVSS